MTEQFEQAKKELADKWGYLTFDYVENNCQDEFLSDLNALLEQHKEMMLREELIAFEKFATKQKWTLRAINPPEFYVDEYLKSVKK